MKCARPRPRRKSTICSSDILCALYLLRTDELERHGLNNREVVVAQHILNGDGNTRIAKSLRLSIPGVKYHVGNILGKTNLSKREELCTLVRHGVESSERTWADAKAIRKDAKGRIVIPEGGTPAF